MSKNCVTRTHKRGHCFRPHVRFRFEIMIRPVAGAHYDAQDPRWNSDSLRASMVSNSRIPGWIIGTTFALTLTAVVFCKRPEFVDSQVDYIRKRSVMEDGRFPRPHLRLHSRPPKSVRVGRSQSLVLECEAGGTPLPDIHWLKDGHLVPQGEIEPENPFPENDSSRLSLGSSISRLHVDCAGAEDSGEYACVAQNPYRRISARTILVVESCETEPCETESCSESSSSPARPVLWTKTLFENTGQDARLVCRAVGRPRPAVRWKGPGGGAIASDAHKYQIASNGDLIVRSIAWSDMGNYDCTVENDSGTDSAETFLYPVSP